ncbi:MAG: sulfite exporter TauE/SafE family protein [Candidatus Magasanikbacteria bacterium]|nr:sulfite exporter TauE/SafE family protein [Candidatus Magasanikbacteria bacterium]
MEIFYIALLTLVAAAVGTVTGFGTSTLMIPVLVIFFPPVEAIFLVAIIHWFGDVWKVSLFRKGFNVRLLVLFGLVGLATSYFGALVSLGAKEDILLRLLGAFLAGYALFLILQSKFKIPAGNLTAISGGALSGFFAGMFGIGGAIRSMFLSAFDLPKAVYLATAGAIGLLVDSTRIITYLAGGATLPKELWYGLALFIPVSYLGAQLAKKIVDRIPQNKFRLVVAVFLFAAGLKLIFWPSA